MEWQPIETMPLDGNKYLVLMSLGDELEVSATESDWGLLYYQIEWMGDTALEDKPIGWKHIGR